MHSSVSSINASGAVSKLSNDGLVVDVRTEAEWLDINLNDFSSYFDVNYIEWRVAPNYILNESFLEELAEQVKDKKQSLFFICKSGVRSLEAALAASEIGYENCYNISDGVVDFVGECGNYFVDDSSKRAG